MNHSTKHLWRQRVRKEFEEPARYVISEYARQGYSKRLTAGAIGITVQTLIAYSRREGINFKSRDELREECKPKPWNNKNRRKET